MGSGGNRWVVVLAGGQGRRVRGLSCSVAGEAVPKQFSDFGTGLTLLRRTLDRAESIAPPARIVAAVDERHRCWWEPALRALPAGNVIVQPRDFGTALGVLGALVRVVLAAPRSVLLVLPSDHFAEREDLLRDTIERALREAERSPQWIILLGVGPRDPDPEYGWIVPARSGPGEAPELMGVAAFVEKPAPDEAERLMASGALWSSFIIAATANTLLQAFLAAQPALLHGYLTRARAAGWDMGGPIDLEGLPALDFSRDVLEARTSELRVLVLPECGWTDLGTAERVRVWREGRALPAPA